MGAALIAAACGGDSEGGGAPTGVGGDGRLVVYVVNYPLRYFAERIGGDQVRVEFPAPADVDPAFWMPDAETVAAYQAADLILLNGAGYAGWVDRVTLPGSKLLDTSQSFRDRYLQLEDAVVHTHGPEGEHSHGTVAFTTWLDPTLAVEQARAIRDALAATRPEQSTMFGERYKPLERELLELDAQIQELVSRGSGRPLLASHPVYQYPASRYGLNLESVHFEPDAFPAEKDWSELTKLLSSHAAEWMLWEGEPLERTAATLRELGMESAVFDPCANVPESGDLLDVMRTNVRNLEAVFPAGDRG